MRGNGSRITSLSSHSESNPPDVLAARLEVLETRLFETAQALSDLIPKQPPLLTVKDLARTLNVSARTVESLIAAGKIRPLWVAGQRRFHPDAINAYLRSVDGKTPRKVRSGGVRP